MAAGEARNLHLMLKTIEFALYNDVHDRFLHRKNVIVSVVSYYKDAFGVESNPAVFETAAKISETLASKGIRVATGAFVTRAHSVSEQYCEAVAR